VEKPARPRHENVLAAHTAHSPHHRRSESPGGQPTRPGRSTTPRRNSPQKVRQEDRDRLRIRPPRWVETVPYRREPSRPPPHGVRLATGSDPALAMPTRLPSEGETGRGADQAARGRRVRRLPRLGVVAPVGSLTRHASTPCVPGQTPAWTRTCACGNALQGRCWRRWKPSYGTLALLSSMLLMYGGITGVSGRSREHTISSRFWSTPLRAASSASGVRG
jgi:hypothetical protein